MPHLTRWLIDLRGAIRSLWRRPVHSLLVVTLVALGVAGTTAIYGVLHSLLIEPLGFDGEDRLVVLDERAPAWNLESVSIDPYDFLAWRESSQVFEAMALYGERDFNLAFGTGSALTAERISGGDVTHDFFRVLDLQPSLGRAFLPEEDAPGGSPVAMIGHDLWHSRFGASTDVIGTIVRLDGESHEIVGVLPPRLPLPEDAQILVPLAPDPESPGSYSRQGIGKLRPGVSPARAMEDLDAALAGVKETFPYKQATSAVVEPLREHFVADSRHVVETLFGATFLVLLVACSNVASLMLAGGERRKREFGVRRALGAKRRTLVMQLGLESLVLSLVGALVGVGLGRLGLLMLARFGIDELPFWAQLSMDPAATALSAGGCVGVLALFALMAALRSSRVDPQQALRGGDGRSGFGGRHRLLSSLVTAEIALAQVLLVAAALIFLSHQHLRDAEPGYRVDGVGSFRVALPDATYAETDDRFQLYRRLHESVQSLPGLTGAALISVPPLQGHEGGFFEVEGGIERPEDVPRPVVLVRWATADYFTTAEVPLVAGRAFREPGLLELPEVDDAGELVDSSARTAAYEVVINQTFVRTFFGDVDPVGHRIRAGGHWLTISGTSRDVRHYGFDQEMRPGVYLPLGAPVWGRVPTSMGVVMAGPVEFPTLAASAREVVAEIDPELPIYRVTTFAEVLRESIALRRLTSWLFGLFAAVALVLAAFGTFAVLSFVVGERRRELGVRFALGATRGHVLATVLGRGLRLAALGAGLGLVAAVAAGGLLSSLLYGVDARDGAVMAAVALLLLSVATLANAIPAWRASRLDPMQVLRDQ